MRNLIINIFEGLRQKKPCMGFRFGLPRAKDKNMPATVTLTNEQEVDASLKITTPGGKPAQVDGVPTWEVVSGDSTVTPAADGLSAVIRSSDDPGDTQILVKADAKIGSEIEEISDIIEVSVQGAMAKNLGVSIGTPRQKSDDGGGGTPPPPPAAGAATGRIPPGNPSTTG
jgi:hypothetical protein